MIRTYRHRKAAERILTVLADGRWYPISEIRRHLPHMPPREVGSILADGARAMPPLWKRGNLGDRNLYAALPAVPDTHDEPRPTPPARPYPRSTPRTDQEPLLLRIIPGEAHRRAMRLPPYRVSERTRSKWERMQAADPLFIPPVPLDTPPPPCEPPHR